MTKVQKLIEDVRQIAAHLNETAALRLEETITYLHTMEQEPVTVYDECVSPCDWFFHKTGPAFLNGDLVRELNTARKYHPCKIKMQQAAEAAAAAAAAANNIPPLRTNPRFQRPKINTGCWNCLARISSESSEVCTKCRRFFCWNCGKCLCELKAQQGLSV